ncbi:MAG: hypothetical protein KDA57_07765 [Planctomycetales bacterium]|nr:hypothetical protein [Planctomycetales bacterium]
MQDQDNLVVFRGFHSTRRRVALVMLQMAAWWALPGLGAAGDEREWELSNYRIRIHLAIDTATRPEGSLTATIAEHVEQRIFATLYPLWSAEVLPASGPFEHLLLRKLDSLEEQSSLEPPLGIDKEMFLSIISNTKGHLVACREVDHSTGTWGPVLRREVRQTRMLSEKCFELLRATFAPLAKIRRETESEDESYVALLYKGSSLPQRSGGGQFARLGTVYRPLKIRAGRSGDLQSDATSEIPWTYLLLEEMQEDVGRCRVHSGLRKPFGVRRRGSVEHLAIALPNSEMPTRVRFHARHDRSQSLAGYEVFQRVSDDLPSQPIGLTDAQGEIEVPAEGAAVTTLFLRSDGRLLAKVPIASGVSPLIQVPIADDTARLRAEATLTSLREQLIDLVARRNILVSRVRNHIQEGNYDDARQLLSQLDDLPTRAHFAQLLSAAERSERNRSREPQVQATIEGLFAETRKLLGRFLNARQITDLQNELSAARQGDAS